MKVRFLLAVMLVSIALVAQDKPSPKLKDEVALGIRDLQVQLLLLEQTDQVKQYLDLSTQLQKKYSTALKDSGIDDAKYIVNPGSLVVTEKPQQAAK